MGRGRALLGGEEVLVLDFLEALDALVVVWGMEMEILRELLRDMSRFASSETSLEDRASIVKEPCFWVGAIAKARVQRDRMRHNERWIEKRMVWLC